VASAARPPLRRELIVDTSREMIVTGGLASLSLRRLAERLGVTAPALYAHVRSKQDLVRAVAEAEFDRLVARFESVDATDPVDRVRAYNRAYVDHAREQPELFEVMFRFPPQVDGLDPVPTELELPAASRAFAIAVDAVSVAMDAGGIVRGDPLLVALALWSAAHGVAGVLRLGLALPPELEEALVDEVTERVLRGYAP
jgi:AcrR family transcriptional regulator